MANSQFGNHNFDAEHDAYLREKLRNAPRSLIEKAERYEWSAETIASMV